MNTKRLLALASSHVKGLLREPAALFLLILFPIVLTLFFGLSFGAIGGSNVTYSVGIVDEDGGVYSHALIENLSATPILKVTVFADNLSANADLSQGKVQALVLIPHGFSSSCIAYVQNQNDPSAWTNSTVFVYIDKGSLFAVSAISPIVSQSLTNVIMVQSQPTHVPITMSSSLVGADQTNAFDTIVPGLFAFASIFLIMTVSGAFTSNRENGLLRRFAATPTTSSEFMLSYVLAYLLIAVLQTALVFVMSYAIGFRAAGGAAGILYGVVLLAVFSVCNVGFGLITATIAKSPGAATGLAFIFVLPQMFLGTFVSSMLSDNVKAISQFMPSYYVTDALTSIYVRGASLTSPTVLLDTLMVCLISLVVLMVGIALFKRYGGR
ncbi:MAG TPA: ABC transporter permease [Methanomassiliicoccales archaeon]|jgi:ABC-type multidrug transport system permease subunit|nr:ABC transporter permease [Methanomassiliicoccales archaeon]